MLAPLSPPLHPDQNYAVTMLPGQTDKYYCVVKILIVDGAHLNKYFVQIVWSRLNIE
jgi:hypothetical protein